MENLKKIPCSVLILTLNCKNNLKRCLNQLKDFAEIVILDGNSTDGTIELAKIFGAKVYPQVPNSNEQNIRIDNFAKMRNRSLKFANYDWVFIIDSDEYLSNNLSDEIRDLVFKNNILEAGYIPRFISINNKIIKHSPNYPHGFVRVFNLNSGIKFNEDKNVHERVNIPDKIKIIKFKNYSVAPWPNYKSCIKKDRIYLKMAMARYTDKNGIYKYISGINIITAYLKKVLINFLKGVNYCYKSFKIYLRYGFKESLPPLYVWRFARYHFVFSYLLFKTLIYSLIKK